MDYQEKIKEDEYSLRKPQKQFAKAMEPKRRKPKRVGSSYRKHCPCSGNRSFVYSIVPSPTEEREKKAITTLEMDPRWWLLPVYGMYTESSILLVTHRQIKITPNISLQTCNFLRRLSFSQASTLLNGNTVRIILWF